MAHFAKIENGIVQQVIVVMDCMTGGCIPASSPDYLLNPDQHKDCGNLQFPATESIGQAFIASIGLEGEWKQTSYNKNFRGNYASGGMIYDLENDCFIAPKCHSEAVLNKTTFVWACTNTTHNTVIPQQ